MAQQILIPLPPGIVSPAICAIIDRKTGDYYHTALKVFEPYNAANVASYEFLATALGLHQVGFDLPSDFSGSFQITIQVVSGADLVNGELFFVGDMDLDSTYLESRPLDGQVIVAPTGLDNVLINARPMPVALASTEQDARLAQAGVAGASSGVGTGIETYKDKTGDNAFISTIDVSGNRTSVTYP